MNAKDIIKALDKVDICQQRCISESYAEIVIYNKELQACREVMESHLGKPVSPAGQEPTSEEIGLTKDFGGLFKEQTLYKKDLDEIWLLVMLWPWQDNEHITIKIVCLKKG